MARLGSVITEGVSERASDVDGSALAPDITSHSGATFYLHFGSGGKEGSGLRSQSRFRPTPRHMADRDDAA